MTHRPARGQQPILTHLFATNTIQLLKISICSAAKVPRLERAGHGCRSNRSSSHSSRGRPPKRSWMNFQLYRQNRSMELSSSLSPHVWRALGKEVHESQRPVPLFCENAWNARAVSLAQLENPTWRTKIRVPVYSEDRPFSGLTTRTEPYLCRCAKSSE